MYPEAPAISTVGFGPAVPETGAFVELAHNLDSA